jgi:hypothetical protein
MFIYTASTKALCRIRGQNLDGNKSLAWPEKEERQ